MKNIITLSALFVANFICAQAPNLMSYQSIVRNSSNAVVTNQSVGVKFSILKGSATGTVVYSETQTATTNTNGLFTTELGSGTLVSGSLSTIDWGVDKYFVKTEIDPAGGTSYSISGTHQLLSVPYAINAKTADNGFKNGTTGGQLALTGSASPYVMQTPATVTGDITITSSAVTSIANNAVTTAKLADNSVTVGKISATGTAGATTYLRGDGTWVAPASSGGASLQLFATSNQSQTKRPYAYSRYTFNYNNKVSGENQSAWTNNTYTVPEGKSGLYNIDLAMIIVNIGSFTSFIPFPEIQLTRNNSTQYYYGSGSAYSVLLNGDATDATSATAPTNDQYKSFSRGVLNITLPLQAGDVVKVFYRGSASSNSTTALVEFSTDGSTYLSIVKLD